jgi:formylglycine-generating enzyme required for sulfatase activity
LRTTRVVVALAALVGCGRGGPPPYSCATHATPLAACFTSVPGGTFVQGAQSTTPNAPGYDPAARPDEGPPHEVTLSAYWIQTDEVTASAFAECQRAGACLPEHALQGPSSNAARADAVGHPANGITWHGAQAFCRYIGARLPTEAEWEFAARGGLEGAEFTWGDERRPGGRIMANTWDGPDFPWRNTGDDGWERTSPVGTFPANGYGLHDMAGNVWEWTDDWYQEHRARLAAVRSGSATTPNGGAADSLPQGCCATLRNPRGAMDAATSVDPSSQHGPIPRKVVKGGSFLCAPSYCRRYRPAARMAQGIDTSTCHLGFRCIVRPAAAK